MQTLTLIIVWTISVYISFRLGQSTPFKKAKTENRKTIKSESESEKQKKENEKRFWHFDGSEEKV